MKKFIKKTIAGLIAGVMAISSMPFTALADTASDKAFIQSKINSGAPTYATTTSTSGNALSNNSGYMNNILVSGNYDQRARAQFAYNDSNGYYIAAHALDKAVAVYDGTNDVKIPVAVEAKDGYCQTNLTVYTGIDHVALKNGGQFSLGNDTWIRTNSWTDYGDSSDTSHDFSTDDTVNKTRGKSATGYFEVFKKNWVGASSKNYKQWKNYITFTPNSSFTETYYASLTTLAYKCQADIYAKWGNGDGDKQDIAADTSDYTVDYKVINYVPLKTLLNGDDLKNTFKTVSANESDYDASTVSAYYSALAELYRFNLTDGLTVDTVATKAEKMKTLITNYNTAKGNLKKLPQIDKSYIDAYDAALKEAEEKANDTDGKYTAESIEALKTVIADVKAKRGDVKTNADLDALTTSLLTAISNLVQTKFTVEFVKIGTDGKQVGETVKTTKEYGQTFEANAEANVKGWVVYTDNRATMTRLNTFDQVASVVITKDAKIEAYLSGEAETTNSSKVTFLGRHNQVVAIRYVADGQPLDTNKEVEVPKIPFYTSNGWDVASVTGDGKEYTVKAIYTCDRVDENDKCTVHFGKWSKAYAYDNYVYLPNTEAGKKYALYSDAGLSNVLTVLDGVDFYAPKRKDIYVGVYDGDDIARVAVMGTFSKIEGSKKSAYYNCKFNLPENAKAIEWGVELKYTDKNGNVKYAPLKAELKSKRNEYTSRLDVTSASVTGLTVRAYVVYSVKNNPKQIVRSAEETVTFNA